MSSSLDPHQVVESETVSCRMDATKYEGGAVGVYVYNDRESRVVAPNLIAQHLVGTFTADVSSDCGISVILDDLPWQQIKHNTVEGND